MASRLGPLAVVGLLISGCVSEAGRLGMPSSSTAEELREAERLADLALSGYLERDVRLQRVSQKLRIAGAPLCEGELSAVLGAAVLSTRDLPGLPSYSRAAEDRFPDSRPRFTAVFPDLPAARAGVRPGDVLVSIDGRGIRDRFELDRATSNAERGNVALVVEREGEPLSLSVERVEGCAYPAYLQPTDQVNAFAQFLAGFTVFTSALVRELPTDTSLALVVGHEMAHQIVLRLNAASPTGSQDNEARADYIGAYIAALAGYPLADADGQMLFDVLTRGDPTQVKSQGGPRSHPISSARTLALRQTVEEIASKQERGEPLRPEIR